VITKIFNSNYPASSALAHQNCNFPQTHVGGLGGGVDHEGAEGIEKIKYRVPCKHQAAKAGVFKQNFPLFLSLFIVCVLWSLEGIYNNISSAYEKEKLSAARGLLLLQVYIVVHLPGS